MHMGRIISALSAVMLLSGCASDVDDAHTVEKMTAAGRCVPAAAYADQNITDVGLRLYEHAYVADHCLKDKAAMLAYLNLSARHGNVYAQKGLAKMGEPVPAADLRPTQSRSSGDNAATLLMLLGAGVSGFNQGRGYGQPSPPLVSTSCTTTNDITNCLSF
jgi:hypothetical protein